ncbi:MAG: IPT/TIG domain-containing protein, partial [Acidimicrobiales bacterium]|nr:IPT/TIG domain-containing protein [Acidimicrobiales bacterium]
MTATAGLAINHIVPLHPLTTPGTRRARAAPEVAGSPHTQPEHLITHPGPHSAGTYGLAESANWAGVVDTGTTFGGVGGDWTVPLTGSNAGDEYSATWIGLDGTSAATLIQTGTTQQVVGGVATYFAWFELLPSAPEVIQEPVVPGDAIQAQIIETQLNVWTITISDLTQHWQFQQAFPYTTPGLSAEWIEEAPLVNNVVAQLADFDAVTFSQIATAAADPGAQVLNPVYLVDGSDIITAYPGDANGSSFSIFYGEPAPIVASVTPSEGPTSGGAAVVISGVGFGNATRVEFGGFDAGFEVVADGTIFATAPADAAPDTVDVTVLNPTGASLVSTADQFTYVAPAPPPPPAPPHGYWLVGADGGIFTFG